MIHPAAPALSEKQLHILLVAEELFALHGFDGTSVRDIAEKAGVNLAMISYYFQSKENSWKLYLPWGPSSFILN